MSSPPSASALETGSPRSSRSPPVPGLRHPPRSGELQFHQRVYSEIASDTTKAHDDTVTRNGSCSPSVGAADDDDAINGEQSSDCIESQASQPSARVLSRRAGRKSLLAQSSSSPSSSPSSASTSPTRKVDGASSLATPATHEGRGPGQWWKAALFIFVSHWIVAYVLLFVAWPARSIIVTTLVQAWLHLLGITAGYHRLWSHRAFEAALPVRVFLAIIGLQSFQGSIFWWAMRHRIHHRFTDTKNDPHDSTRGFWYSHIGWLFEAPPRFDKFGLIGSRDLLQDEVVVIQRKYLLLGYVVFGALYPAWMGYLLANDAWAGFWWIGFVARFLSWHCIWSINSVSHWVGEREFSLKSSAVHMPWLGVFQNGEGHHNYHHEFPSDYRHGVSVRAWDPTKWCVMVWARCGLAWNLRETPHNQIAQARTLVLEEKARAMRATAEWGPVLDQLPMMLRSEFHEQCQRHHMPWIIIDGLIVDVSTFEDHPGGQHILRAHYGQDATSAFHGQITLHTEAATHLMQMYAIARVHHDDEGGDETGAAAGAAGGAAARRAIARGENDARN